MRTRPLALRLLRLAAALSLLLACGQVSLAANGRFQLTVVDSKTKEPIPCRIHLKSPNGKPRRVTGKPFWHDHFVFDGKLDLKLSPGTYTLEIERGPEYKYYKGYFVIDKSSDDSRTVELERYVDMSAEGWWSGELHVHRPVKDIELLMQAEDLHVAPVITWWNERNEWSGRKLPNEPLVRFDENRFYHLLAGEDEREGGALLYFNLDTPLEITGAEREYPSPLKFLAEARRQPKTWVDIEKPFWWDVPVWLASGMVDSIGLANNHMCRSKMYPDEAWGKPRDKKRFPGPVGNGQWTQEIYYQILNCGLRLPPSAGSASGVLPNPVGYNRMYVYCGEDFTYENWWEAFRAGRVVVTNGPMLRPIVNGEFFPGHVFTEEEGEEVSLDIALNLGTRDHIEYLEVVKNGQVERSVRLDEWAKEGKLPPLTFTESGWFLVRAVTDVQETYRFASTAPYYVEIGESKRRISRKSTQFFLDWVEERMTRIKLDDEQQRREVLQHHEAARKFWEEKLANANAD